ncbi:prefoldin subunit alpha [Methanoculleus taiwanensis]|uniref:prefoldin subunit alpha n=1 Tax=Methanoculleus taiwanensis TaxID=1550565 RepID=UPI000FFEA185|nr:prefoldin subunit alpha [Methanoculleus taiwanensis]
MDSVDPREVQTLQMYLNEYGQQMEVLAQQLNLIEQQRLESLAAVESIQALGQSDDGAVLLPIGGGAVVRAKVLDPEHVMVNIGSDVVVERTHADAVEYLQDRITELEALGKKVAGSLEQLRGQVNEISRRLEAVYRQRGQPPQPGQGGR